MEMQFYYYDPVHALKPFFFSLPGDLPEGCEPPDHTLLVAPRLGEDGQPLPGEWPVLNAGGGWDYAEDHRQKKDERDRIIEGTGTPYWLAAPLGEDDWQSEPRYMTDIGPLPEGALLTRPEKPLVTAQDEKRQEINRAHGEVLSYLLAESPHPTAVEAALAVEDMRADDPEGLGYVRTLADTRRAELLAAVDAAQSVGEVEAVVVSYPV